MSLNLSKPPAQYDASDEAQARRSLEQEDRRNLKTDTVFDKIKMRDAVTGLVKTVTLQSGVLTVS